MSSKRKLELHHCLQPPSQPALPMLTPADLVASVKQDMQRLRSQLEGWNTYSASDVIDVLADTLYGLECRRSLVDRFQRRTAHSPESLASVLAGPPVVVRRAPQKLSTKIHAFLRSARWTRE